MQTFVMVGENHIIGMGSVAEIEHCGGITKIFFKDGRSRYLRDADRRTFQRIHNCIRERNDGDDS